MRKWALEDAVTAFSKWPSVVAERVEAWFFEPIDGRPLAVARIGLGLTLACAYMRYARSVPVFYGPSGIGGHDAIVAHPGYVGTAGAPFYPFRVLDQLGSLELVWVLWAVLVASALAFAAGFFTRTAGTVAVALHLIFTAHNPFIHAGWSWMIGPYILYVVLGNPGRGWSADAWRLARQAPTPRKPSNGFLVTPWAVRLLQVHVATMYMTAGWQRLDQERWVRGEMLVWAMADGLFGRLDFDYLGWEPLLRLLNYAAYALEPAAPFLLFVPRVGPVCALLLAGMHAGIELTTEVGFWGPMMISSLAVFLPARWFGKLRETALVLARPRPSRYPNERARRGTQSLGAQAPPTEAHE